MITLDLLPSEYRKKKKAASDRASAVTKIPIQFVKQLPLKRVYLFGGGGLVVLYTFVVLGTIFNNILYKKLEKELEHIAPERNKIIQMNREYKKLQAIEKAAGELSRPFSWSRKLQQLSHSVVGGVWLKKLSLSERYRQSLQSENGVSENLLILTGSAASARGDELALVGRFIRSLKENEGFFQDFVTVELESTQRRSVQSQDVMDFKIICTFQEGIFE